MDDLIKNGFLKEERVTRNINPEKDKKISGSSGLLILIAEFMILYFSFISFIDLAWAGNSGKSFTLLLEFIIIGVIEFFIIRFLMKKKGGFTAFLMILSIITSLFIAAILIQESQLLIHEYKFQAKKAIETNTAKIEYQKILTETKQIKIMSNDGGILKTDKDFSIILADVSYTPEVIDYINRNIIGHSFDITVPEFKSNEYPVSFAYQQWLCQCDILINGQSLIQILTQVKESHK